MPDRLETALAWLKADDARRAAAAPAPTLNDRLFKLRNDLRREEREWQRTLGYDNAIDRRVNAAAAARYALIRAEIAALQIEQAAA